MAFSRPDDILENFMVIEPEIEEVPPLPAAPYRKVDLNVGKLAHLGISKKSFFTKSREDLWRMYQQEQERERQIKFEMADALWEYYKHGVIPPGYT